MKKMVKKSVSLPPGDWDRLEQESDRKGISSSELIRRIVDVYLEQKQEK